MKVVIASLNPVKMAAAKQAFDHSFTDKSIVFNAVDVPSGVSDQPVTILETMEGAINRAQAAASKKYDYSIGIEGGLEFIQLKGKEHATELSWACVLDCKTGIYELASGPGFPLLPGIVSLIKKGMNLNDAMAQAYGVNNAGMQGGYIGWLTNQTINRQQTGYESVLLALSALHKDENRTS